MLQRYCLHQVARAGEALYQKMEAEGPPAPGEQAWGKVEEKPGPKPRAWSDGPPDLSPASAAPPSPRYPPPAPSASQHSSTSRPRYGGHRVAIGGRASGGPRRSPVGRLPLKTSARD